MNKITIS